MSAQTIHKTRAERKAEKVFASAWGEIRPDVEFQDTYSDGDALKVLDYGDGEIVVTVRVPLRENNRVPDHTKLDGFRLHNVKVWQNNDISYTYTKGAVRLA